MSFRLFSSEHLVPLKNLPPPLAPVPNLECWIHPSPTMVTRTNTKSLQLWNSNENLTEGLTLPHSMQYKIIQKLGPFYFCNVHHLCHILVLCKWLYCVMEENTVIGDATLPLINRSRTLVGVYDGTINFTNIKIDKRNIWDKRLKKMHQVTWLLSRFVNELQIIPL